MYFIFRTCISVMYFLLWIPYFVFRTHRFHMYLDDGLWIFELDDHFVFVSIFHFEGCDALAFVLLVDLFC